ncbi:MAG: NAD-dependent epimerase/dehydratase family protein [Thermodesulfobacteria bacterium]|nr:NAD-dependent epimerase/dehydratase family protein [Thermodesulfobacteriota bacterium]
MKILVTGGAGFIGSNVVDRYIELGHDVVVVDNLYSGKLENLNPKAKFYLLDIRSPEFEKVLEIEKPDVINHHAAQISVPYSVEDPRFDADVNIQGFVNMLEAAKDQGVKKIIFISSGGAIYGEAEEYPTTENYPPKPLSPYAIAKAVSEDFLFFYNHQYGLDYTVLRYANIYGPRQIPHGEAGVVAIFMDRLLAGKKCTLYHFPEDPRGMIRDYCFVGDVVEANVQALDKGSCQAYNIGTGVETKTQDLFEKIYMVMKERVNLPDELAELERKEARAGDLKKSCLDCSKAKKELEWTPAHDLEQGLRKTLDWRLSAK